MGDFQDVFGAGADSDMIIDRYSRDYVREGRLRAKLRASGLDEDEVTVDPLGTPWHSQVYFTSYAAVKAWDQSNTGVAFVRQRSGDGYLMTLTKPRDD